ncbi:uncharacterized protein LOC141899402 [Tubulanus polymorphus]|uniref:uncharacterized protein LOC141899402 n=1 Tax=Tubulanus polymorphus TaxID=672921 RepID=UPI003DA27C5E
MRFVTITSSGMLLCLVTVLCIPSITVSDKLADAINELQQDVNKRANNDGGMSDSHGRMLMGTVGTCDNLEDPNGIDWNGDKKDYKCDRKHTFKPNGALDPKYTKYENVRKPPPKHICMQHFRNYPFGPINYNPVIPTAGPHRPNWPVYGEYVFMPRQRWLHSLEHGAIVFLYHPCADPIEVDKFRKIVEKCLYRHVITPNRNLTHERPFALLSWGNIVEMSHANTREATLFIKTHAKHGLEMLHQNGRFNGSTYDRYLDNGKRLLKKAAVAIDGDKSDPHVCRYYESLSGSK